MRMTRGRDGRNEPAGSDSWFATFTFLDASGAIGASQFRAAKALLAKCWRWTLARLLSPKVVAGA